MPHDIVNSAAKRVGQARAAEPFGFNNPLPYLLSPDFSTNCARIYRLLTVSELLQGNPTLRSRDDIFHMAGESPRQGWGCSTGKGPMSLQGIGFLQGKEKESKEGRHRATPESSGMTFSRVALPLLALAGPCGAQEKTSAGSSPCFANTSSSSCCC